MSAPLLPDNGYFDLGPLAGKLAPEARIGFSGFRVTGPMNRPDLFDEIIVFQGASYFRALSRGQIYGLSARGLALNVGQSGGRSFRHSDASGLRSLNLAPLKSSFMLCWTVRRWLVPTASRSTPGAPTSIAVQTTLYPRKQLPNVGIAPLTSMFLFSAINRARINDFRPAVHDSDGLAILNGWGEHLWRPLNNPRRLQTSNFLDQDPRGFGLIQRSRAFAQYQDLEAHYERRPSAWVEPAESGGRALSSSLRFLRRRKFTTTSLPTGSQRSRSHPGRRTHSTTDSRGPMTCREAGQVPSSTQRAPV